MEYTCGSLKSSSSKDALNTTMGKLLPLGILIEETAHLDPLVFTLSFKEITLFRVKRIEHIIKINLFKSFIYFLLN